MTSCLSLSHLQEEDIKILRDDYEKFCGSGPMLMGTKFVLVSNKIREPDNLCMALKATGILKPYYLVFGFSNTSKTVKRVGWGYI